MKSSVVSIDQVTEVLSECDIFITSASFESRSLEILSRLRAGYSGKTVIVAYEDHSNLTRDNAKEGRKLIGDSAKIVWIQRDDPVQIASVFRELKSCVLKGAGRSISIDVTCFSHEVLLMLLSLLWNDPNGIRLTCIYLGAVDYSTDTLETDQKWLSKGCKEVRSVLGFPGRLMPGRKTTLVLLSGYEYERAAKVMAAFEGADMLLGVGAGSEVTHDSHREAMRYFSEMTFALAPDKSRASRFEFSPKDPIKTRDKILEVASLHNSANVVVVPLNTKLATLGVGLAARINSDIQIAYAEPEVYNELYYVKPDSLVQVWGDFDSESVDAKK